MPPKRKSTANLDTSDAEGPDLGLYANEDENAAPKKRGRKSLIDAILKEEARGTPAPVLPQNQWSVSLIQPQNSPPTKHAPKRRKVQSAAPPLVKQRPPSPGTPPIWGPNKGDFYSAFKSLTESFGGISFANLGTFPVLAWLLEGPRWPDDILDGESLRLSLVTEFKPRDQSSGTASAANLEKKKGGQKRRTKREDSNTVSTSRGNGAHAVGAGVAPRKRWPCLVPSPIYNADYPTFCECLQPQCAYHCPIARCILSRVCTTYSWPPPSVCGPAEERFLSAAALTPARLSPNAVKMYAQVVPELASLLDHMERKSPVLVISTTDEGMDTFLPFQLPAEYGCVVLGFFNVESVECESEDSSSTSSVQPGQVSWRVQLRYAPPSDTMESSGNLVPPWWLTPPTGPGTSDVMAPPVAPMLEPEKDASEVGAGEASGTVDARWCIVQALDGNPRRSWWHCLGCGRINQRHMLMHRRCPFCQRSEDPAPPFAIEDVVQDTSAAPYPCNHAPKSMKADDIMVKEFQDMTSVYCYRFHDEPPDPRPGKGARVKHIFTGPHGNLKVQATSLFLQIQEGIELGWQSVATGVAEGQYYSWASPRHGWVDKEIPECIRQARKLISKSVGDYGDRDPGDENARPSTSLRGAKEVKATDNVRIDQIVALAWTASGSRKGAFVSAKSSPAYVLCLGANVELELERCSPDPPESGPAASPASVAPVGVDEEKKPGGRKRRRSRRDPDPESGLENNTNLEGKGKGKEKAVVPKLSREKPKLKPKSVAPPHERLKISMVHGDVLILSGGNFIYTLTRTGMSILLFALPDAQH